MTDLLTAYLGEYPPAVETALNEMAQNQIVTRIWAHDHTVWRPDPTEISNRLGWLDVHQRMEAEAAALEVFVTEVEADEYTAVLLLGMGGSSLAPEVFSQVFGCRLALSVLDSTDPGAVLFHARRLDPAKTLFVASTKSGSTVETLSALKYFYNQTLNAVGSTHVGKHFVAITDPGSQLAELATKHGFRRTFLNDPNIGGRFSALSYFGLVPAALVGVDLPRLLERAGRMAEHCAAEGASNPAARLGVIISELGKAGWDKLTLVASPQIASFGYWVEQLVAESSGKDGKGILPVEGETPGAPGVYDGDRLFVYLQLAGDETHSEAVEMLRDAGRPVVHLLLQDRYDLGEQFFLWEFATAVACHRLGVNPFDQPNVEAAKELARQLMATYQRRGRLPETEAAPASAEALTMFLNRARPGDYIALQAYVQPSAETDAALLMLRTQLRDHYRLATTVGYGPRFLHSTGQLHKGDAGHGLFVQLTADNPQDAPIPEVAGGTAWFTTFGVLKAAQALGDLQALRDAGRRVIRIHLSSSVGTDIRRLASALL